MGSDFTLPTCAARLSQEEEAGLVAGIKAGDQAACTSLVVLFGPQMMVVARRFMRCDDDCNDALQDAFISAFKAVINFEAQSRLSTWLHRITVNSCLMKLRRGCSRRETSIEDLPSALGESGHHSRQCMDIDDPVSGIEVNETREAVRQAIDQLPDSYRTVLLLRDIEEMDSAATAGYLATTENNVKMRLRRGRKALRTLLEPTMATGFADASAKTECRRPPIPSSNVRLVWVQHPSGEPE